MIYKCNLHTHTQFCDGQTKMEQMVLEGIEKGFEVLGFSPHVLTPCDPTGCMTDFEGYRQEFLRLKQKYSDQITLLCGVEYDAFGIMPQGELDYVIGSVHFLKTEEKYLSVYDLQPHRIYAVDMSQQTFLDMLKQGFGNDVLAVAQNYFDTVVKMVKEVKPTIIGHFDLISLYGDFGEVQSGYQEIAKNAVKQLAGCGSLVELNTGRLFKGKGGLYPADFLVDEFVKNGFDFVLSNDAHKKVALGFEFDNMTKYLKDKGLKRLATLTEGGKIKYVEI